MLKRLSIITIIILFAVIFSIFLGVLLIHYSGTAAPIHGFLESHTIQFAIWRYMAFFLVIYFWPQIIKGLGKLRKWHPRVIVKLIRFRWKMVGFFVLFELLFVYNLFGKTVGFIVHFL